MIFVKSDNLFMDYAHAKRKGDMKEAERLSKIIDDNAYIAKQYFKQIQIAYRLEPVCSKFSFDEWLKWQGITVIKKKASLCVSISE